MRILNRECECGTRMLQCISQGGECCRHCHCRREIAAHAFAVFSRDPRPAARGSERMVAGSCATCRQPLYGRLCWNPGCADSVHDSVQADWPRYEDPIIETRGEEAR